MKDIIRKIQTYPRKTMNEMNNSAKSSKESQAEMIIRMFPSDANPAGNVFGGEILKQIDTIAGIVAQRHCASNVVTASIDRVNFLKPVFVGDVLVLHASLNYVHNSSMEIEIKVESENLKGDKVLTGTAFVTMVALDEQGKPTKVPNLCLETEDEKMKFEGGKLRMEKRLIERSQKPNSKTNPR